MIIIGVGASVLTQKMPNCHNFRLVAPMEFKIQRISRLHGISGDEAERLIVRKQKQRNAFIKDFLNQDVTEASLYDAMFNNAKNTVDQIANMICSRVLSGGKKVESMPLPDCWR